MFISDTNDQGSFNHLSFSEKRGFEKMIQDLDLNNPINKARLDDLLGDDLTKVKMFDFLNFPSWGLTPIHASAIKKGGLW